MRMTEEYKRGVRDTLDSLRTIMENSANVIDMRASVSSFVEVWENLTYKADGEDENLMPEMAALRNDVNRLFKQFDRLKEQQL